LLLLTVGIYPPSLTITGYDTSGNVDFQAASGGNPADGAHYYKYTYVNTDNYIETEGSVISAVATTTATHKKVILGAILAGPSDTNARYIYRTKLGNATDFYFVAALADNETTIYTDAIADSALGATVSASGFVNSSTGLPAGSRSITVAQGYAVMQPKTGTPANNNTHFAVGDFIQIGPKSGIAVGGQSVATESEVRRIEFLDGTTGLQLDTPTGFFHEHTTHIQRVTAVTDTSADKYMTVVPGVYETVEVPDPEMAIEPRYFLGTASKRNPYNFYKGQQTYTGSLGGFVILDGKSLRFPIGKVTSTTTYVNVTQDGSTGRPQSGSLIDNSGGYKKGDVFVTISNSKRADTTYPVAPNVWVLFTGTTTLPVSSTISNATTEIRQQVGAASTTSLRLNAPLQFDHADNEIVLLVMTEASSGTSVATTSTTVPYTHAITETVDLDSISWHVHVRDSSETDTYDFDRRYHGGKVGSMSLTAEEGGLLTCSWDGVNFLGMNHNQQLSAAWSSSPDQGNLPFYTKMQSIRNADVTLPITEPYYFSEGQVTLFGTVVARVRSFTLSVNNNEEPRYYLKRTMGRHRGPTEIMEQRREYSCAVTMALPDAITRTASTETVFKELLMEGDFGGGMQGFAVELRFDRGANDSIVISIPDDGVAGTGGNNQGAFINTAPHAITDANPMEVDANILFRNLKIVVQDNVAVYI